MHFRSIRILVALSVVVLSCLVVSNAGSTVRAGAATPSGPSCTFNGSSLPLVTGVSAGSPIAISCKGMGVLHPYLVIGTSLLLGIDPAAAPLLSGQVVSLAGLKAILAALPELDLASEALPISGLNGDVNLTWPVPTFQPLDPNAGCPPTQKEFNSGLLGCAVAMIDLLTFKPVSAGSAVFEYSGFPFLPPNPTLALSTTTADRNQTVSISDAPGATTYWWLTTLAKLQSALGGGAGSPPSVTVTMVDAKGNSVPVSSKAQVTPASYNGTFSTPALSGTFVVPTTVGGPQTVKVQVAGTLEGLPVTLSASSPLSVNAPPAITSANSTTFTKGSAGTFTVTATGSPPPTFTESGALPTGVTLTTAGILSGTPTVAGSFPITITAHNGIGSDATQNFTLTVLGFHVTTTTLPSATRGVAFSAQLNAAGGLTPYKWTKGAVLPKGLTLSSAGLLSGTPSTKLAAGSYPISVQVHDSTKKVHQVATATLALTLS
jgi:hypothetical protein